MQVGDSIHKTSLVKNLSGFVRRRLAALWLQNIGLRAVVSDEISQLHPRGTGSYILAVTDDDGALTF